jgi:hypothetical protein
MGTEKLAKIAVTVTQIIKTNLDADPQDVIFKMQEALPAIPVNMFIEVITTMARQYGFEEGMDVNHIIAIVQAGAKRSVSDIVWNETWQNFAQAFVFAAHVAAKLLPPKWGVIITAVLDAYDEISK